jgi:tetratricopeptide (TPR) repeat protein
MKQIIYLFLFLPMMIWSQSNFDEAEKLFNDKKYEQAQPILEALLKASPSNLKTIEYLGDIAGSNKKWDAAMFYYKKLKQIKPSEANYFYKYGGALGMKALEVNKFKALGMIGEIRESFEKAIKLNPAHIDARWALIELYITLPVIIGGSETKALKYANELSKISSVDGYLSRGHIDEYYRRYEAAERQYKKAFSVASSRVSCQKLANLYKNKMNDPEKAKITWDEFNKKNKAIK